MKRNIIRIISTLLVLVLSLSCSAVFASAEEEDFGCREAFAKMYKEFRPNNPSGFWFFYEEGFRYYADNDTTKAPEFIQAFAVTEGGSDAMVTAIVGDYYIFTNWCEPYILGIYIYTPADGKIYTLAEAIEANIEGIDVMLKQNALSPIKAKHICDMDNDEKLTIKDATFIQKVIADLEVMPDNPLLSASEKNSTPKEAFTNCFGDLNRDGVCNIKDATAIQKHLAGLEY